ncbi:hypothetical protein FRX31_029277 [Thalictrum thalictroides]|uniref:Uncharacterized protein n=1 Tax=Thalictrum thalictroides TaxID=46969 RepID=A0A7J6V7Y0_THATH|nr:hypothetical protein FRX31_029277 [Thalictrum thalictroides]
MQLVEEMMLSFWQTPHLIPHRFRVLYTLITVFSSQILFSTPYCLSSSTLLLLLSPIEQPNREQKELRDATEMVDATGQFVIVNWMMNI